VTPLVSAQVDDGAGSRMRIHWDDLDFPDQPGEYWLNEFLVVVTLGEIEIWEDHPDASFLLIHDQVSGSKRCTLGMPEWQIISPNASLLPP
jgi:hypothetical protein